MGLEIALTRLTSVVLPYEFVFVAVSIALCGLGLGALALHQASALRPAPAGEGLLAWAATGFSLTSLGCVLCLLTWLFPLHLSRYWLIGLCLLLPFCAAGVFFAGAFSSTPGHAARLYAADLAGAAAGALGSFALLRVWSPIDVCAAAATVGAGAAALCAPRRGRWPAVALLGVLSAAVAAHRTHPVLDFGATHGAGNLLFRKLAHPDPPQLLATSWNAVARTDLVDDPAHGADRAQKRAVYMDGQSPTYIVRMNADLRAAASPAQVIAQSSQQLPRAGHLAFASAPAMRVLSLGPGGGRDALLGLLYGATSVEGAELNPSILPLMKQTADFNGHLYELPNVRIHTADARRFLRQAQGPYDLIFSALVLPVGAGSASLLPGYLYTVEAFGEYWDRLSPTGRLGIIVHEEWLLRRLASAAMALLVSRGVEPRQAARHLSTFSGGDDPFEFLLLLHKEPLGPPTAEQLRETARRFSMRSLLVAGTALSSGYELTSPQALERFKQGDRRVDYQPCTDDRPFCFEQRRGSLPPMLEQLALSTFVLALLFTAVAWFNRAPGAPPIAGVLPFTAYFAALGVGHLCIQAAVIQELTFQLGYGAVAVAVGLCAMLLSGGVGSWVAGRLAARWGPARCIVVATGLAAVGAALLPAAFRWADALAIVEPTPRAAILAGLVAVPGFFLGMPFPLGLQWLARQSPKDVPWMWGVNGVMAVAGSLAAALLARKLGFGAVLLTAAGCYLAIAVAAAWAGTRAGGAWGEGRGHARKLLTSHPTTRSSQDP